MSCQTSPRSWSGTPCARTPRRGEAWRGWGGARRGVAGQHPRGHRGTFRARPSGHVRTRARAHSHLAHPTLDLEGLALRVHAPVGPGGPHHRAPLVRSPLRHRVGKCGRARAARAAGLARLILGIRNAHRAPHSARPRHLVGSRDHRRHASHAPAHFVPPTHPPTHPPPQLRPRPFAGPHRPRGVPPPLLAARAGERRAAGPRAREKGATGREEGLALGPDASNARRPRARAGAAPPAVGARARRARCGAPRFPFSASESPRAPRNAHTRWWLRAHFFLSRWLLPSNCQHFALANARLPRF